jgi:hypothetical protein
MTGEASSKMTVNEFEHSTPGLSENLNTAPIFMWNLAAQSAMVMFISTMTVLLVTVDNPIGFGYRSSAPAARGAFAAEEAQFGASGSVRRGNSPFRSRPREKSHRATTGGASRLFLLPFSRCRSVVAFAINALNHENAKGRNRESQ